MLATNGAFSVQRISARSSLDSQELTFALGKTRGGSHLMILVTVAHYSDHRGEWTVDQATLQRRTRLSRRRVQELLADLTATGDLAVIPGDGRGKLSTYRLLIRPERARPSTQKGAEERTLSTPKGAARRTLSAPPTPPFPPHPQSPLTPKSKKQETFGLPPAAAQGKLFEFEKVATPCSPLPFGEGGSGTHGRGAGGEGPGGGQRTRQAQASSPLPGKGRAGAGRGARGEGASSGGARTLSSSQSAVAQVNRLLQSAAIPLPTPSQIGLWSKTLGGIEPLLNLLRRLIANGLAAKRDPIPYIHSAVTQSATRPEPWRSASKPRNVCLYAGADERRVAQAARIAAFRGHW